MHTLCDFMVQLQILPKKEYRNAAGIELLRAKLPSAGLKFVFAGAASISAEIDEASFTKVFGASLRSLEPKPPGDRDFGQAGGYAADSPLVVPPGLAPYVESVTLPPPLTRL